MEKTELVKAILKVMQEVKGIDKSMTVGTGNNSYKGVSDKDVKKIVGDSMSKHGLTIVPINVESSIQIDRWEDTQWKKQKQQVFTEVKVTYCLMHESGQSIEVVGYGHGVDSQDKAAGKATTYALKYALLYTFMIPTGSIDDADNAHSDINEVPKKYVLKPGSTEWNKAVEFLIKGGNVNKIRSKYEIKDELELMKEVTDRAPSNTQINIK